MLRCAPSALVNHNNRCNYDQFLFISFCFFETRPKGEEEEEDERNKMMWEGLLIVCLLLLNFFFLFFFSFWPLPSRLLFRRIFLFQVIFF